MARRLAALLLWAYFAWYLTATIAQLTDGPGAAGPIAGLLTIAIGALGWARDERRVGNRGTAPATDPVRSTTG